MALVVVVAGLLPLAIGTLPPSFDSTVLILGSLGVLVFLAVAFYSPFVGLVICLAWLASPVSLYIDQRSDSYVTALMWLVIAPACAMRTVGGRNKRARTPLDAPMLLFLGVFLGSAIQGFIVGNERWYVFGDLYQALEFVVAYFLASRLVRDKPKLRVLLITLLAVVSATLLVRLSLYVMGSRLFRSIASVVVSGTEMPRITNLWLETLTLSVLIALLSTGPRKVHPIIWLGLIVPYMAYILLTLGRGNWLLLGVAIMCYFVLGRGKRLRLMTGLTLVLMGSLLVGGFILAMAHMSGPSLAELIRDRAYYTVEQFLHPQSPVQQARILEVQATTQAWLSSLGSFLIGHGLGAEYMGIYAVSQRSVAFGQKHYVHTFLSQLLFRSGLLALLSYGFIAAMFLRRSLQIYRRLPPGSEKALCLGLFGSYVGVLASSFGATIALTHPVGAFIGVGMALVLSMGGGP